MAVVGYLVLAWRAGAGWVPLVAFAADRPVHADQAFRALDGAGRGRYRLIRMRDGHEGIDLLAESAARE